MPLGRRKQPAPPFAYRRRPAVTIRWATAADAEPMQLLAELDEAPIPPPPLLLGLVGDELWVAMSASTGAVISHPFKASQAVATLVAESARQLTVPATPRRRLDLSIRPAAPGTT